MLIKALHSFTVRNAETGNLTSVGYGTIVDVDDTTAQGLIDDGLAEAYGTGGAIADLMVIHFGAENTIDKECSEVLAHVLSGKPAILLHGADIVNYAGVTVSSQGMPNGVKFSSFRDTSNSSGLFVYIYTLHAEDNTVTVAEKEISYNS